MEVYGILIFGWDYYLCICVWVSFYLNHDFYISGLGNCIFGGEVALCCSVPNGNQGTGVDLIVPEIVLIVAFSWVSILFVCELLSHTGAQ